MFLGSLLYFYKNKTSRLVMRKFKEEQMFFGEVDISQIKFDMRSRDEIPQLLAGLQYIYCTPQLKEDVFSLLGEHIEISKKGRRGMDLWNILVLGVLRLNCNWDYDKLKEMSDNHFTIRQMLGLTPFENDDKFPLQTIRDNVCLLTPELLNAINTIVVKAGQNLVKKKDGAIKAKCDSFVFETNVHYPTDTNLLMDAVRKVVEIVAKLCNENDISGWRQNAYQLAEFKKLLRICQKIRKSTSKDPEKQKTKEKKNKQAHCYYIIKAEKLLIRAESSLLQFNTIDSDAMITAQIRCAEAFINDGKNLIDQIQRRVINGEKIPHNEKLFSLFQRHTEWICKGKAGVSQELGKRLCIIEDQYGFVLSHEVMDRLVDTDIAIPFIEKVKNLFPELYSCSFDKGFWSPENKNKLEEIITVALPRKGRLTREAKEYEKSSDFIEAKKKHSAVESCINALENHGLDRCPDCGIQNFERYVSLAILGRNMQKLGSVLLEKKKKKQKHSEKIKEGLRRRAMQRAA